MAVFDLSPLVNPKLNGGGGFIPFEEAAYDPSFDFPFSEPYQRARGDDMPSWPGSDRIREWTLQERKDVLLRCHLVWERNPLAKGAIRVIRGFVVSTGLNVSYRSETVKVVLEKFRNENRRRVQRWERQWFEQLLVDGEVFVRLFSNKQQGEMCSCSAATVKPWLVEYIETEEGNRDEVVAYHIRPEKGTGTMTQPYQEGLAELEAVGAGEVVHCYVNALGYEVRGRSELFAILPWLRAYREWLENRARINRYKGFLYHLKLKGATGGQVSSKQSAFRRPPAPGSVYVSSDLEELEEMGGTVGADRAAEDGRQIKLMNLAGLTIPEYMVTEGQNANLATARSQQLPALRSFLTYQDIYLEELWRPLYEAVLEAAGLRPADLVPETDRKGVETGREVTVREAFAVEAQQVVDEDPKDLAEALTLHQQNRWASMATLSARAGYDWEAEKELLALEEKEEVEAVYQGRKLGATKVAVPSFAGRDGGGPEEEEAEEE